MQPVIRSHLAPRAFAAFVVSFAFCAAQAQEARLTPIAQLELGVPTEIAAYDSQTGTVLVTLAETAEVVVIDISDRYAPHEVRRFSFLDVGSTLNSVACRDGLCAASLTGEPSTDQGFVVLFNTEGTRTHTVRVGAMPDMVTFTPDGRYALTANEGEPAEGIDPNGSVSIIDLSDNTTRTVELSPLTDTQSVTWLTPPEETPASMIEPEYIAVAPDSDIAYVVCQENNAVAMIDIDQCRLMSWHWLGTSSVGEMEALRQPDTIIAFDTPAGLRIVTANEGDPRDEWGNDGVTEYHDVEVVASSVLSGSDPIRFGAHSISLYDSSMRLLDDSRNAFARTIADLHDSGIVDSRTIKILAKRDDKRGVEPEGLAHTLIGEIEHIFVGLERAGMVAHFACRAPYRTLELLEIVQVETHDADGALASPEGLLIVPGEGDTPPTLVVTDEVHGTVTFYAVTEVEPTSGS